MIDFDGNKVPDGQVGIPTTSRDGLPYRVELWKTAKDIDRVLGLASNAVLAQAIFNAAISEHPGRRITLCRGEQVIDETRG
jgi:hypothetical protein